MPTRNAKPPIPRGAVAEGLLDVRSIAVEIGGVAILHDVSLRLEPGEILGLLGPNGAGKTTTLGVALGLLRPKRGAVGVFGLDPFLDARRVRGRLGALPERGGFYGWMTASAYLAFFARLHGVRLGRDEIAERLGEVGLAPRPGQPIESFSHGMRQRLGLARAFLADPQLLLLDEPTNGLDPRGRREVHDLLLRQARRGVGILLSSHLLDDVERMCDRIVIIADGRTVASGTLRELTAAPAWAEPQQGERYRLRLAAPTDTNRLPDRVSLLERDDEWVTLAVADGAPEAAWRELMFLGWRIREIHRLEEGGSALERLYLRLTSEA